MFYITPDNNTCFDLEQILMFAYFVDEETKELDEKSLVINFKTGHIIKLECMTKENAHKVFYDLYKHLNAINKPTYY